jgi:hypothetical protein
VPLSFWCSTQKNTKLTLKRFNVFPSCLPKNILNLLIIKTKRSFMKFYAVLIESKCHKSGHHNPVAYIITFWTVYGPHCLPAITRVTLHTFNYCTHPKFMSLYTQPSYPSYVYCSCFGNKKSPWNRSRKLCSIQKYYGKKMKMVISVGRSKTRYV